MSAGECGNFLLEVGEQCTDAALGVVGDPGGAACQGDCTPQSCTAGANQVTFTLVLDPPPAANPTSTTLFVAYRSDHLRIPGSGLAIDVRRRVTSLVTGATLFPNDRDYALRVVLSSSSAFPASEIATVTFDICSGATVSAADVTCFLDSCAGAGGPIAGCTCAALAP